MKTNYWFCLFNYINNKINKLIYIFRNIIIEIFNFELVVYDETELFKDALYDYPYSNQKNNLIISTDADDPAPRILDLLSNSLALDRIE